MEPSKDCYGRYIPTEPLIWTAEELAEFKAEAAADKRELEIRAIAAKSDNVTFVDFRSK